MAILRRTTASLRSDSDHQKRGAATIYSHNREVALQDRLHDVPLIARSSIIAGVGMAGVYKLIGNRNFWMLVKCGRWMIY